MKYFIMLCGRNMDIIINEVIKTEKEILRNLIEKYLYEFSQYENMDVSEHGLYECKNIDNYWIDKNKYAYFIKIDGNLAGFIMIDNHCYINIETEYSISEFFVMYKYKKLGIGRYTINYIFDKFKGKWSISYAQKNKPALEFWNKIVNTYTKGKFKKIENYYKFNDGLIRDILIFET
jgi:predicted acetyltransferase